MDYCEAMRKRLDFVRHKPKLKAMYNRYLEMQSSIALVMSQNKQMTTDESNEVIDVLDRIWDNKVKELSE